MAGLYEEEILGAQQQRDLARKLRETEIPSTGHMIGDWYVAPTIAQQLSGLLKQGIGAYKESQAEDELKDLRNQRLKDVISAKQGLGIPASQRELEAAGTPAESPSWFNRAKAFVTPGEAQPKGTPAVPMQQPPVANWSNQTPDQQMQHVLSASEVAPELTNTFAAYQKLKTEEAKNKQEALYKGLPAGTVPGKVPGTFDWMKDETGKPYNETLIERSLANANLVDPVEQERIGIARAQLQISQDRLKNDIANKAETETPYSPTELEYLGSLITAGVNPNIPRKRMSEVYSHLANEKQNPNEVVSGNINLPAQKATEKAFSPQGKQGQAIIALATAGQHLNLMSGLADALQNNDLKSINSLSQTIAAQTGEPAPTNFDAAKRIVAGEIMKTVTSTGGGVEERKSLAADLDRANSPAQLKGVMNTYKDLLAGKVHALAGGYKSGSGREFDYNRFGVPEWEPAPVQPVEANAPKVIKFNAKGEMIQ